MPTLPPGAGAADMAAAIRTGWRRNAWPRSKVTDASRRGLAAALRELYAGEPGPTGVDALAVLEQRRREVAGGAQGSLPLRHEP